MTSIFEALPHISRYVIGPLKIWCRYDNQSASLFWVVGIFARVYVWRNGACLLW